MSSVIAGPKLWIVSPRRKWLTLCKLVSTLQKLLEQHVAEQTEQIIAIREREKWNKILERKILEINKEADALIVMEPLN